jgi:phage terminase large subunit
LTSTQQIIIPPKLIPVFVGEADIRAAYGGRGSGKTRTFAKMTAVKAYMFSMLGYKGIILCCREFMNSLDDSSMAEVKEAILSEPWLAAHFDIGEKYIRTRCGSVSYKFAGLDRNISSVKSKARILLCWVDEADPVTETAWQILIPTLREEVSELWVTWNPDSKHSATDARFRQVKSDRIKIAEINYKDNPWFPAVLERVRLKDMEERPDSYAHIWEGDYAQVITGAYFAKQINEMKAQGRLSRVAADPLMTTRAYWDIGGTGDKSDACAIWIVQFVGREIRVLNYYEAQGQPLATHVQWLRSSGYENALCVLPHDGRSHDKVYKVTYKSALEEAGFNVRVIENQGAGAAMLRIEAVRRLFPSIWINEATTHGGVDALGAYCAKLDEKRKVDLGPNHNWASHAADAFGLMAIDYEVPKDTKTHDIINKLRQGRGGGSGWQGA